ncbi:predicted protein [Arabidopsis lyrata subsp. lyrata]|uniref:Predicted protein n=1 Tax=Arabidopsis lyrata subsp. lyrata TaxID=81972 RepID=D7KSV3_ARALL|nr:predicted protein [Arabidopsis lyrata subsp. lyrata]
MGFKRNRDCGGCKKRQQRKTKGVIGCVAAEAAAARHRSIWFYDDCGTHMPLLWVPHDSPREGLLRIYDSVIFAIFIF